jgi:hypothetical protein
MSTVHVVSIAPARVRPARLFYTGAGLIALVFTLVGFHHFYFAAAAYPGRPITPPIRGLVVTHGVVMGAWVLLALVQPALIALGYSRVHQRLGRVGGLLALVAVVVGLLLGVQSARVNPPEMLIWGVSPKQFMAVPFFAALVFGTLIALGLYYRRRLDLHRPLMLLATYSAMSAAISRIDALNSLYVGTVFERLFGPFFITQLLCGALLVVHCVVRRHIDRCFAIGFAALTVGYAIVWQLTTTAAWDAFASLLV